MGTRARAGCGGKEKSMAAPATADTTAVELDGVGEGSGWGCGRDLGCAEESFSLRPDVEVVWIM